MSERYLVAGALCVDLQDARVTLDGKTVRLGMRAFNLLVVLMERPQVLLTKDELFARVWTGLHVSDAVLTTAMKELRQAIGDPARQPRFIETAHGRGYRFLLPVERSETMGSPAADPPAVTNRRGPVRKRRIGMIAAGLLILVAVVAVWAGFDPSRSHAVVKPDPKSIVVMPFEDLSPGGDQRWFADGLAEEVQTALSRTPDLRVVSRASAARLSREGASGARVAEQLATAQFLEGSVRRAGDRVRVTVKLVRAVDGAQIWSQSYDRDASDVISIQEDIAFRIASALKTVMDPAQLRLMVAAGTQSVDAHEAYMKGLALDQRQFETGDLAFAVGAAEAYERARTLDPTFAAAHWKAAQTWFGNQTRVDSTIRGAVPESVRRTRYLERVDAAIANSRDSTESLKYQAARASIELQFRSAHALMARYLAARPRDLDAWEAMADLSAYAGQRAWMRRAAERIHTLSLEDGEPRSRAITVSVMAMDLDAAVERGRAQLALRPDNAMTQYQTHRALIWTGQADEARALLPDIQASRLPEMTRLIAGMRQACADGRVAEADRLRSKIDDGGDITSRWTAAGIAGDRAGATATLRPLDTADGLPRLMQYLINPTFDSRSYPMLTSRLGRNGITPVAPVAEPFGCRSAPL